MRDRYYRTNIPGASQPEDRGISFQSVLDSGYIDRAKSRAILASDAYPTKNMEAAYKRYRKYGFGNLIFSGPDCDPKTVRYLNQQELERLMTVPNGYTALLNRNQALKLLGNGRTVDVIAHLLKGLE